MSLSRKSITYKILLIGTITVEEEKIKLNRISRLSRLKRSTVSLRIRFRNSLKK